MHRLNANNAGIISGTFDLEWSNATLNTYWKTTIDFDESTGNFEEKLYYNLKLNQDVFVRRTGNSRNGYAFDIYWPNKQIYP